MYCAQWRSFLLLVLNKRDNTFNIKLEKRLEIVILIVHVKHFETSIEADPWPTG